MATHSSILAWRIPEAEEPGGLHVVHGLQGVRHDWMTNTHNAGWNVNKINASEKAFSGIPLYLTIVSPSLDNSFISISFGFAGY